MIATAVTAYQRPERRGVFCESIAMSKAYAEARAQHGESGLPDEIVAAKPELDHTKYRFAEELRDNGLQHLRDAMALLESKATTAELDGYRHFVLALAHKVAAAHRKGGQSVRQRHPADRSGPRHDPFFRGAEDTERRELTATPVHVTAIRA